MSRTDAERIARRYPARRTGRWWIAVAVACAVLGGAWLLWAATHGANPSVSGRVSAFEVTSDATVDVLVTVQRPDPSVAARCTVIAQSVSYETVGQYPLEIAPSDAVLSDHRITIKTLKRATSVSLQPCVTVP